MTDKRRADLAVPYIHKPDAENELPSSVMFRSLPMIAMFMRSKILAWAGLFLSMQAYLSQPINSTANDDSITLSTIGTAIMGVGVSYMDFVVSPGGAKRPAAAAQ